MSHYESDESTLVDDDGSRRRRQTRQRSYSHDGYPPRQHEFEEDFNERRKSDSKLATLGKVAIVAGVIGGVMWYANKKAQKERDRREREHRRRRRRDFEKAKDARRREEERLEREIERDDSPSSHREMRLIEDAPRGSRARSPSRDARKLDQPPRSGRASRRGSVDSFDSLDDAEYERARRQPSRGR